MAAPMSRIEILGIRGHGYHGVLPDERRDGQEFSVDVVLEVDTTVAAAMDDLSHTVDYGAVAVLVHEHITGEPHLLIEALADRIAEALIALERVDVVEVSVHKPHAPIAVPFTDVIVRVRRAR